MAGVTPTAIPLAMKSRRLIMMRLLPSIPQNVTSRGATTEKQMYFPISEAIPRSPTRALQIDDSNLAVSRLQIDFEDL
jgi:hypothetical protein